MTHLAGAVPEHVTHLALCQYVTYLGDAVPVHVTHLADAVPEHVTNLALCQNM